MLHVSSLLTQQANIIYVELHVSGYEVSGMVDAICDTVTDTDVKAGDRVILHLTDDDQFAEYGSAVHIRKL